MKLLGMINVLRERRSQVETPEFRRWFGHSRVVDDQGEPLVVYKAMYPYDWSREDESDYHNGVDHIERKTEFPTFDKDDPTGVNIAGFFGSRDVANNFAAPRWSVFPVYLSLQNPFIIDAKGESAGKFQFGPEGRPFRDAIRSGRYDGVIIRNTRDEGTIYVALKPNQIKSAISNKGRFDADDPRLTESFFD